MNGRVPLLSPAIERTTSLDSLTRLGSNPFWYLIDQQLGEVIAADLARQGN